MESIRMRSIVRLGIAGLSAFAAAYFMSPAVAGEGAQATDRPMEEIIVTSQRRAENMQSVPVAVTAFSGDALDDMGIVDIKGITERTPGFTMGVFNPGQPQYYIRGIGSNEDGAGGDQSVIVFVDEVYIGRSAGSDLDLFDLERVEVLRGPQGTLFGKNVIGGAVSLVTKKPSEETEVKFEGTAGNLGALTFRGLASGPIADNAYAKFSFSSRRRDGYLKSQIDRFPEFFPGASGNLLGKFDQLDVNTDSFRGALRFTPTDRMEINLTANHSTMDRAGPSYRSIGPGGLPFIADAALLSGYEGRHHENLLEDPGFSKNDIWGITARLDYDIGDAMTFTSLTSYRDVEAEQQWFLGTDNLAALRLSTNALGSAQPALVGSNDYTDDSETFTHEFRLTGSWERLNYVTGLYYLNEKTDRNERNSVGLRYADGMGGVDESRSVASIDGGDEQGNETDSYAVFGQVTFDLTQTIAISLGGRQTWEEKDISRIGTPAGLVPGRIFDFETGEDWSAFTMRAGLEWQATDDIFLYATISEGFKSGGYQGLANSELIAITPFDPEEATLYEVGIKSEWWDNRVRINAAVFTTDYKDLQILQLLVPEDAVPGTSGSLITQNAADADIEGVEVEFTIAPTDNLTIQGAYTHLHTEFANFFIPSGFRPPDLGGATPVDRTGNELRNAPKHAFNVLVRYDWLFGNGGALSLQGDWRYKDKAYQDPDVFDWAAVPSYDVVDFRASYLWPGANFETTLWMQNAFDEDYFLHNWPLQGSGQATPAPPRTYGLTVTWRND